MGLISDFFLSDETGIPAYDCSQNFPAEDRCEYKYITPLEASGMLAVLRGKEDRIELMNEFTMLTDQDADEWTFAVPADMVTLLSELGDDKINSIAEKFADITKEELGWSIEDCISVFTDLRNLARRAIETKKKMYLWISL